jgi:hypothetical protein
MKNFLFFAIILIGSLFAQEYSFGTKYKVELLVKDKKLKVIDTTQNRVVISQSINCNSTLENNITKKGNILYANSCAILQYEDFDFDGKKDFLIYSNGSVYKPIDNNLYLLRGNNFKKETSLPGFRNVDIYEVDSIKKQIKIYVLCGTYIDFKCYRVFKFKNGKFEETETQKAYDDYYDPYYTQFIYKVKIKDKFVVKKESFIVNATHKDFKSEFSFELKDGKRIYLLLDEAHTETFLSFFYTNKEYKAIKSSTSSRCKYMLKITPNKTTLSFKADGAFYTIYQKQGGKKITKVGLIIKKGAKSKKVVGLSSTISGDLRKLSKEITNIRRIK